MELATAKWCFQSELDDDDGDPAVDDQRYDISGNTEGRPGKVLARSMRPHWPLYSLDAEGNSFKRQVLRSLPPVFVGGRTKAWMGASAFAFAFALHDSEIEASSLILCGGGSIFDFSQSRDPKGPSWLLSAYIPR